MTTLGMQRLETTRAFWGELKDEQFYFGSYCGDGKGNTCSSVHCLLGWLPTIFPDDFEITDRNFVRKKGAEYESRIAAMDGFRMYVADFFSISLDDVASLFYPYGGTQQPMLSIVSTLAQVLAKVDQFIAAKKTEGVTA